MTATAGGILGIDPGLGGALVLCRGLRQWVAVLDMPVFGDPPELDAYALRDLLRQYKPDHVNLELVNAMPSIPGKDGKRRGMGATSAFRFGGVFYAIKAVLICEEVPFTPVPPAVWKKAAGLLGSGKGRKAKEASRQRAMVLFPDQRPNLLRKKDEARAEAMLIAAHRLIAEQQRMTPLSAPQVSTNEEEDCR